MPRAFLCVMDSVGIGGAPDADQYGGETFNDVGSNTMLHIAERCASGEGDRDGLRKGPLHIPNLNALGMGAAVELSTGKTAPGLDEKPASNAVWGVGREISKGKDTPSGHWEIAGCPVPFEWGYFPDTVPAFPKELTDMIIAEAGLPGILGDCHASGTVIIEELGEESIRTGKPICYTSADSVFQIAAHEEHFGLERLYDLCKLVFKHTEPMRIGRVIARPFVGETAKTFERTGNRRDFALDPPEETLLDRVKAAGRHVFAVGKISDIYAGRGVTHKIKAHGNMALFEAMLEAEQMATDGDLVFTNFVQFDTDFGHRRDVPGYANALEQFDRRLPEIISKLNADDLLLLTADHGNDPTWQGSDHTREQTPILVFSRSLNGGSVGLRSTFSDIGESVAKWLGIPPGAHGRSFL
ncbi:MAG: phosphopentomutase [Hyphomicrobiaceae bacterium]|nr:phosphopentomutase [Hyphomicrobiaceae bacterium]MCC0022705.1 phosphopentomutase [Hyphomicrobiaceae bacterium]